MANVDISNDGLVGLEFESASGQASYLQSTAWQFNTMDPNAAQRQGAMRRPPTPLQTSGQGFEQTAAHSNLMSEFRFQQAYSQMQYAPDATTSNTQYNGLFGVPMHQSPTDFLPTAQGQNSVPSTLSLDGYSMPLTAFDWQDFSQGMDGMGGFVGAHGLSDMSNISTQAMIESGSPTDTFEVRSLTSSSSNDGWGYVEFHDPGRFVNPTQTIHRRAFSASSESDFEQHPRTSFGSLGSSFVDVAGHMRSPSTESNLDFDYHHLNLHRTSSDPDSRPSTAVSPNVMAISPNAMARSPSTMAISPNPIPVSPHTITRPIPIKQAASPMRSPASSNGAGSPPARSRPRKSPIAKSPIAKPEKSNRKLPPGVKSETEKRVGKRKGPLRPDQRKQASEIRKLRACLRCKFLKKTCDKGEPCAGCQPSHARLWQVPCTRIDIKEIGYFMKDWKADYERHVSLGFSVGNIKGFSDSERTLFITHGYGHMLPVKAREVYVRDERCFGMDWVETALHDEPLDYEVPTAQLSAGMEGISTALLSDYLDRHIDGGFEGFVDDYFEGTPFLTQMLKTAYRYYFKTKLPIIRKALKLILAYNLTLHVTMVEGVPEEEEFVGKIEDETSKYFGRTMAPVMINFQIKCAMADMWRELQKDILEELSALYSSVYSGDKLKNWPTIFMLASILLAVWEEMQFDCHYRVPDAAAVDKFCSDMETTPVGVIVGLFQAISQKLPAFTEWDSSKHQHLLNSNQAVCETMTEVRDHVREHESYLRGRANSTFDRKDFDSLTNKFVSKLVIRAN